MDIAERLLVQRCHRCPLPLGSRGPHVPVVGAPRKAVDQNQQRATKYSYVGTCNGRIAASRGQCARSPLSASLPRLPAAATRAWSKTRAPLTCPMGLGSAVEDSTACAVLSWCCFFACCACNPIVWLLTSSALWNGSAAGGGARSALAGVHSLAHLQCAPLVALGLWQHGFALHQHLAWVASIEEVVAP